MKKSDLKTEIRNRILEKKAKMAEAEGDEDEDEEEGEEEKPKNQDNRVQDDFVTALANHLNMDLGEYDRALKSTMNKPTKYQMFKIFLNFLNNNGSGDPIVKGDLIGMINNLSNQTDLALEEEDVEEMSTSGGAGSYLTKYAFKLPKDYKKVSEGQIEPKQKKKD